MAQKNAAYASSNDIWKFISELGISKVGLSVVLCFVVFNSFSSSLSAYLNLFHTSHVLTRGSRLRSGDEVVCVRNFLICIRLAILH